MNRVLLMTKLSVKCLLNNRFRFVLTISGFALGLLVLLCGIEVSNAYAEDKYNKLQTIDENLMMVSGEACLDLTDAIYKLNASKCQYSYNYYKISKDCGGSTYLYKGNSLSYNLSLMAVSYGFENGYQLIKESDLYFCSKNKLLYGAAFSEEEYENGDSVCVLERSTATILFGKENAVGEDLQVGIEGYTYCFRVVGIVEDSLGSQNSNLKVNAELRNGGELIIDRSIIVPLPWYDSYYKGNNRSSSVAIFQFPDEDVSAGKGILLRSNYKTDNTEKIDYYSVWFSVNESTQIINGIFNAVLALVTLVAGLMVMNTLMFSIKERIREIGIKRALGAKSKDIVTEMIIESIIQGVVAYILSVLLASILFMVGSYICVYMIGFNGWIYLRKSTYLIVFLIMLVESILFSIIPCVYATKIRATDAIAFV